MGGELDYEESKSEEVDHTPPTNEEMFWKALPWYLSIGMSEKDYWQGDPKLVESYREAYKLAKERKNQELWLQGVYFLKATACAVNGSNKSPYPDEPLPLSVEESNEQIERKQRIKDAEFEASMMSFMASANEKFSGEREEQ